MQRMRLVIVGILSFTTISLASLPSDLGPTTNQYWFPKQLDLSSLKHNGGTDNPYGAHFDYAKAFLALDLKAVVKDLRYLLTHSQPWWPADFGNYGPFFIRLSWHSAGTYRIYDGRGGSEGGLQRFSPQNSWPDNANLDKARRLLWPIKQKYGRALSWSDLLVLVGNVALEEMGFKTLGFAGGRIDQWQALPVNWGSEKQWGGHTHRIDAQGQLKQPHAATQMGLIYVNPEGVRGQPDPLASAQAIRTTFTRMGMNDEETVALIAGGHAFGKAHGAAPSNMLGPAPAAAPLVAQGLGWHNQFKTGKGPDTITSGLEGAWAMDPVHWQHNYLHNLIGFSWVKTKSPGGALQWIPKGSAAAKLVPDAYDPKKRHAPIMFTTDLALKADPQYRKIVDRFLAHPKAFDAAFAKAWFKLIHRDMGPRSRYLGPLVPQHTFLWQDPLPVRDYPLINKDDIAWLKRHILEQSLPVADWVGVAWSSAATFRKTDKRGGANGARVRLLPQKNWQVNNPVRLARVLSRLTAIKDDFNQGAHQGRKVSLADLIVLAGDAAIEQAAARAGVAVSVPFVPGRVDATAKNTDAASFAVLEPKADGFINYYSKAASLSPTRSLVERADLLNLTIPEMTVLVGGLRVLNVVAGAARAGVFTSRIGVLSTDFFTHLLSDQVHWKVSSKHSGLYEGFIGEAKQPVYRATAVDLIFGAHPELKAVAQVYASADAQSLFVHDFVKAWVKVMQADRFDLHHGVL